jgi:hypothetical protein
MIGSSMPRDTTSIRGDREWQEPRLTFVGHLAEIVQGGGGKLSPSPGDPGENRVEKPHCPPTDPRCDTGS